MRLATLQCPTIVDDAAAVTAFIVDRLRWAEDNRIDLLVLPEGFLLGHSYDPETIRRRAAAVTGGVLQALCRQIAGFSTTLVVGAFHQRPMGVFNSAFVVEGGRIVGAYDKAHPNEPGITAGTHDPTFTRSGIRYGINICCDANYADAADRIARQGADLIVYPLNNMLPPDTAERWREKSLANLIARATQTRCWIASADVTGSADDLLSHGCTAIVAPDGRIAARVPEGMAGAAVYDLP